MTPITYSAGPTVTGDGIYNLSCTAHDRAGNTATGATHPVWIDSIRPTASLLCNGSPCGAGWYTSAVTFSAGGTDANGIASSEVSLDGGSTWSPSATPGDGTYSVIARAFDPAGNVSNTVSGTVNVDTTAPAGVFHCNGSTCGGNWYTGAVAVSLSATDTTSGIVPGSAVFTYDGGATWVPSALLPDGTYNLEGRATDFAGNTVTIYWVVQIDSVAPMLQVLYDGNPVPSAWSRTPVHITATASDATSGIYEYGFTVDGGPLQTDVTLNEGVYTIVGRAEDNAGNVTTTGAAIVRVDTTPPAVVTSLSGTAPVMRGWYQGGMVTLTCAASDATSGVAGVTYINQTATAQGATTLSCTATDVAGNTSGASNVDVYIDSVAPNLQILYNGNPDPSGWSSGLVHITATASDATSGVYSYGFTVDGGPLLTDTTLGDGYYVIEGYAEDTAGNITRTRRIVGVDTTAPSTAWNASPDWVRGTVTLTGKSDDAGSGVAAVYISFDGKTWIRVGSDPDWSYTWDTTQYADQLYMLEARAVDLAGNEEHTAYLVIGVDNTNPEVDLSSEWTAPSAGDAGGSDLTSGVARARVTISGNGIAPWAQDYGSVPGSIDWNGRDGNGVQAGYGDYDVMLEVWDRAGNYSVRYGVIHLLPPPPEPQPTEALPVIVAPTQAPTKAPDVIIDSPKQELPTALPFWSLILPIGAVGVWLSGSSIAIARDRRWSELRGIRQVVNRYLDQKKTNFPQEGEDD
ncbi:MAG: Ig-like domain-containing protein [Anaerolineales bacterium]